MEGDGIGRWVHGKGERGDRGGEMEEEEKEGEQQQQHRLRVQAFLPCFLRR